MSDLDKLVELAGPPQNRKVETLAGAKKYGEAIGTPIRADMKKKPPAKRPVTIVRLQSLVAQMKRAKEIGDASTYKRLKVQLRILLTQYAQGKKPSEVFAALNEARSDAAKADQHNHPKKK